MKAWGKQEILKFWVDQNWHSLLSVFQRFMYLLASVSARMFSLLQWGIAELKPSTLLHDCLVAFFNSVAEEWDRDNHARMLFFRRQNTSRLHGYAKTSNSCHDIRPHKFAKPFSPESLKPARHSWEWMSAFNMSFTFSFWNVFHFHFLSAPFRSSRRRIFTYILIFSMFESLQYWVILTL